MTDPYKQADRARWLRDLLCGALIGAGAILPGVSGGVLAVVFDVYRPMMETLAHPGRGIRKYWHIFLPLGIGWAVGFLGLAKGISAAYALSDAATIWLFIGLIAGTFPALWREAGKEGHGRAAWIACGVCALSVFLSLFYVRHVLRVSVTPNFGWYNFCGALWGASVVLPGLLLHYDGVGAVRAAAEQSCGNAAADPVRLPAGDAADHAAVGPGRHLAAANPLRRNLPRDLGHRGGLHTGDRSHPV